MHYGMVIDLDRCIGCQTCAMACRLANNLPNGTWWNRVLTDGGAHMDTPRLEDGGYVMEYIPVACQHCDNPACAKVCPVGATYKDPETGVVRQDYDKCIGCRMCVAACPYTGVRSFNREEPKYAAALPVGDADVPAQPEARGGEVHILLSAHHARRGPRLHGLVPWSRAPLGRSGRSRVRGVAAHSEARGQTASAEKGTEAVRLLPRLGLQGGNHD